MRLFPLVATAFSQTTFERAAKIAGSNATCGESFDLSVENEVFLGPGESCTYRIFGNEYDGRILSSALYDVECENGEMWIVTNDNELGPYCANTKRRKRDIDNHHLYTIEDEKGNLLGNNYKADEIDIVFRNGAGIKFKFSFQFEFDFQPGFLGDDGMCSYESIESSNSFFNIQVGPNSYGALLWKELTRSLADFHANYDNFKDQCRSFSPVHMSCNVINWESRSWKQMLAQVKAIINAQCSQCVADGMCRLWNSHFENIRFALEKDSPPSIYKAPESFCDEDQCKTHTCQENAICIDKCYEFTCACKIGFYQYEGVCKKMTGQAIPPGTEAVQSTVATTPGIISTAYTTTTTGIPYDPCDGDQCYESVCQANSHCVNKCKGFSCVCADGFDEVRDLYGKVICEPSCDENQCYSKETCPANATCVNKCKGFECKCNNGFHKVDDRCEKDCDENQCSKKYACPENSTCNNKCMGFECMCNSGYHKEEGVCVPDCDDKQCSTKPCGVRSTCVEKCQGFECKCDPGFTMDSNQSCCDENQCKNKSQCPANATCTNKCVGFECKCEPGFHMKDNKCEPDCDVNQCTDGNQYMNACPDRSKCVDECDGFRCDCNVGYTKTDEGQCCDEDQCKMSKYGRPICGSHATCVNKCIDFECVCNDGYHKVKGVCVEKCDVDQCQEPGACSSNASCVNKCQGFDCICDPGFHEQDDKCVPDCDVDQCKQGNPYTATCPDNSTCKNKCLGFECVCDKGFTLQDEKCCDVDQCAANTSPYTEKICPENSTCKNLCVGFECNCIDGFHKEDGKCVPDCDADQCATNQAYICPANATCQNLCTGFKCICNTGFQKQSDKCVPNCDEDQCKTGSPYTAACSDNAICVNLCEGFRCDCKQGFEKVNNKCVPKCDPDQCANQLTNKICPDKSSCVNLCKGFRCDCDPGFNKVGDECCDKNQCTKSNACPPYSTCHNKCSGYECRCNQGFTKENGKCVSNNPCYGVKCGSFQSCRDGKCHCNRDYFLDSKSNSCKRKINECLIGHHNCHKYATCTDTLESFSCQCKNGYKDTSPNKDGRNCVHPYYTNTGMCNLEEYSSFSDHKFREVAFSTSYSFQEAMQSWTFITAELSRLGENAKGDRAAMCNVNAGIIGCQLIDYTNDKTACDWAHRLETLIRQVGTNCNEEWSVTFEAYLSVLRHATCVEPDDCLSGDHNCSKSATCESKQARFGNAKSGFICKCNPGFYGNGIQCEKDNNECTGGTHRCSPKATCTNQMAGYTCKCNAGSVGNGYECHEPVNECANKTHDCDANAKCNDLPNGFQCRCDSSKGFYGNGKTCSGPRNECEDGTHTCHSDATCTDTYSGFSCKCPQGWFGDGRKCWPPLTCPWQESDAANGYKGYKGDFDNGLCSLKYVKICTNDIHHKMIDNGQKVCNAMAADAKFKILQNELFILGKTYEKKFGVATTHLDGSTYDRYGAQCATEAGAVPCTLINFHNIFNGDDLFARIEALVDFVFEQCSPGYAAVWKQWLARYRDTLICPVDECTTGEADCHKHATCHDLHVDYECKCNQGYEGDGYDCQQIDYCSKVTCPMMSDCQNKSPGFECVCHKGFHSVQSQNEMKCVPNDPCLVNNGGCSPNASCASDTSGLIANHSCHCKSGFEGDGFTCAKIDPCAQNNCSEFAKCTPFANVKTNADYNCQCQTGYAGNGFVCAPMKDPCDEVTCDTNAHTKILTNQYGIKSCICECNSGYTGNGRICTSTNPCLNNDCDENASCIADPVFGYRCECLTPYEGDGRTCTYVDPCTKCDSNANCTNQKICVCRPNYIGDGFVCKQKTKCDKGCPKDTTCQNGACVCVKDGFKYSADSNSCVDINECAYGAKNNCNKNADCINTKGGFRCKCKMGYKGDGISCERQGALAPLPTASLNPTGENTDIYAELSPGQCALMGFEWENMTPLLAKMKWSKNVDQNQYYVEQLFSQFQFLGKKAIVRGQPQCDVEKAGIVPCSILYFPHDEHRCQLVKRTAKIFANVAEHCNTAWKKLYGDMMNALLQNNSTGKKGVPCPSIRWLPTYQS